MSTAQRLKFENDVAALRRLINRTPRWRPAQVDDEAVMIDALGQVALVFHGPWKTNLHTFFTHFDHDVLIVLLGLLEAAPGTRAEGQALRLLEMMRLPSDEPDAR
ncbi:hypothetical protein [Saccharothrix syringae]|nr:hypothetical protein [Saccharothrix syringae]